MSSYTSISSEKLSRLIGTAKAPTLIDVRIDQDFAADPRMIPGALRRSHRDVQDWATRLTTLDKDAIVVASGAVELVLAGALVALPKERKSVGWLVAAFFVAVFPGNVHQWQTGRSAPMMRTDRARFIRLLLQPALVAWAMWSTRGR